MQKAVSRIAAALALFVLGLGGCVAIEAESFADLAEQGVTQPDSALAALWMTTALIPALGALANAVILNVLPTP